MVPDPTVLELQVVSPMFVGGAEPRRSDPLVEGLRPPSLRGLLRYWFRAVLATDDLRRLRAEETAIFGSSEQPSAVVVRTSLLPGARATTWTQVASRVRMPMPQGSGLQYLGAVALRRSGGEPERRALDAGVRCHVELRWRRQLEAHERQRMAAVVWLISRLGSLGSRARRGFGAIQVVEVPEPGPLADQMVELDSVVRATGGLQEEFRRGIHALRAASLGRAPATSYPNMSVATVFGLGEEFAGWADALERIGELYREYRAGIRPLQRRLPFGAPIGRITPPGLNRRASPLRFRPLLLGRGRVALVGVRFEDQLWPGARGGHEVVAAFVEEVASRTGGWVIGPSGGWVIGP